MIFVFGISILVSHYKASAASTNGSSAAGDSELGLKDFYRAVNKECGSSMMPMGMNDSLYTTTLAHHFNLVA
jgi:hypothetical protein